MIFFSLAFKTVGFENGQLAIVRPVRLVSWSWASLDTLHVSIPLLPPLRLQVPLFYDEP